VKCRPLFFAFLPTRQANALAKRVVAHSSKSLVRSWSREDRERSQWRNYEAESALRRPIAQFILLCPSEDAKELWQIFTDATPSSAEEVSKMFEQVIYAEDQQRSGPIFWTLWND